MTPLRRAARSIGLVHPVDRPQGRVPGEGTTDSREDGMTPRTDEPKIEINRGLLVGGAVLMSVGAVVGMAGALATSVAVIGAAREWVRQRDEPPSALARRRLAQARTAAAAGAQGWREHGMRLAPRAASQTASETADANSMGLSR